MNRKFQIVLFIVLYSIVGINFSIANTPSSKHSWELNKSILPELLEISPIKDRANYLNETFIFPEVDQVINSNESEYPFHLSNAVINDPMSDVDYMIQNYQSNPNVQRADSVFAAISENKLIDKLTGAQLVELPVGIKKTFGSTSYTVAISRAEILPTHIKLEVFCMAEFSDGRVLHFGSDNIKFSVEGGFIGETTLGLFSDFAFFKNPNKMAVVLNEFQRMQNGNHDGTYITFDCDGFVEMRLDGSVELSRDWVKPCDQNAEILPGNDRVNMELGLTVTDWDDMVIDVTVPSFVLTQSPDMGFMVNFAVVDFSDLKNAPNFVNPPPPPGQNPPASSNLWRGVYFKNIAVILPKVFKDDGGQRINIGATDLYIESSGVTGTFYGTNVLPWNSGKIKKWKFSVDSVYVELLYNQFSGFGFAGRIGVPIAKETTPFKYSGSADLVNKVYNVGVSTLDTLEFPLFKAAEVVLLPNSIIQCTVNNNEWDVAAEISGSLNIGVNENNGEKTIDIAGVEFRKLIIETDAPYLGLSNNGGSVTLTTGAILNGSPLMITQAGLVKNSPTEIEFTLGMEVELMNASDGGVNSSSNFGIVANLVEQNGIQKWEYDRLKLNSINIHIAVGSHFEIKGGIEAFNNGNGIGFKGSLQGGIIKQGANWKFSIVANVMFGTTHDTHQQGKYKYWMFDGYVAMNGFSIDLVPGVLAINGFGGGACHHMRVGNFNLADMAGNQANPSSGITYIPDNTRKFGIKASLGITSGKGAFNGIITLELSFGANMNLKEILFYGKGEFAGKKLQGINLPDLKDRLPDLQKATNAAISSDKSGAQSGKTNKISVAVFLRLNFDGGFEMHGSFGAWLDAAQGKIKGVGVVDLLISPMQNKFHIWIGGYHDDSVINHLGDPIPPVGVTIQFSQNMSVQCGLYFLAGNDVPSPPGIHPQAAAFFGIPTTSNNRDDLTGAHDMAKGAGFAFGAFALFDINYTKPGNNCFYVKLAGGVGFDISLLKYPYDTKCSVSGNHPHGLKGWRAKGAIWAYLELEGKMKVLVPCVKAPNLSVGILLQADVAKPSYFNAHLKLKIWKFNLNVKANLGDECGQVLNL